MKKLPLLVLLLAITASAGTTKTSFKQETPFNDNPQLVRDWVVGNLVRNLRYMADDLDTLFAHAGSQWADSLYKTSGKIDRITNTRFNGDTLIGMNAIKGNPATDSLSGMDNIAGNPKCDSLKLMDYISGNPQVDSLKGMDCVTGNPLIDSIQTKHIKFRNAAIDSMAFLDAAGTAADTLVLMIGAKIIKLWCTVGGAD